MSDAGEKPQRRPRYSGRNPRRFDLGVYVHAAAKDNTVWYDDVALSSGYIGPKGL